MFRNGDNQQGICPLEFLQEVWHQASYPLHYWRNLKPPPSKYQSLREPNICKHVCSSVRCLKNILHYQDQLQQQQHQQQQLQHQQALDPICEKQERYITTYKNPAYVRNILTCNPSISRRQGARKNLAASKCSYEFKENNPNLVNSCADTANCRAEKKRKCSQPRNNLNKKPDMKMKRFDRLRNDSVDSSNGGIKFAMNPSLNAVGNISSKENRYINNLMTYARVDYPNVIYKDTENYKNQNPVHSSSYQLKSAPNRRHTLAGNSYYCQIHIPVPSTFRPLGVTRISNYQQDFKHFSSVARPLVIRYW